MRLSQNSQKAMDGFRKMSDSHLLKELDSLHSRRIAKLDAMETTQRSLLKVWNPHCLLELSRSCGLIEQCTTSYESMRTYWEVHTAVVFFMHMEQTNFAHRINILWTLVSASNGNTGVSNAQHAF